MPESPETPILPQEKQPSQAAVVWQQNELAEARYTLSVREQKLVLYVISMIEPDDDQFRLYKINVRQFAEMAGLDSNALYRELREIALEIKSKPLVIEGHLEPNDPKPKTLITSWFADALIDSEGDGTFGVTISPYLRPYLLKVKREFFRYRLAFALHLRSAYAIRLYQWAKRWQFAGKRRISVEELRVVLGTLELGNRGKVVKVLLEQYKHLKSRAIKPAIAEINRQTDIEISFLEHKVKGSKTVEALTFRIRLNSKAGELESVSLPPATQLEFGLENQEEMERVIGKAVADFGLSRNQEKFVRGCSEREGLDYVNEKVAVIRSKEYKNAAAAFLAALRDDWKLPVKLKKGSARSAAAASPAGQGTPAADVAAPTPAEVREGFRELRERLRK